VDVIVKMYLLLSDLRRKVSRLKWLFVDVISEPFDEESQSEDYKFFKGLEMKIIERQRKLRELIRKKYGIDVWYMSDDEIWEFFGKR